MTGGVRARLGVGAVAAVCVIIAGGSCTQPVYAATSWTLSATGIAQAHSLQVSAPANVTSSCPNPSSKIAKVSWTAVSHATFVVYASTTSSTTGFVQVASGVSGSSWTSGTLATGTYWFEVALVYSSLWASVHSSTTASRQITNSSPNCS